MKRVLLRVRGEHEAPADAGANERGGEMFAVVRRIEDTLSGIRDALSEMKTEVERMANNTERVHTRESAAGVLSVSTKTLTGYATDQGLPHAKDGSGYRFVHSDLIRWLRVAVGNRTEETTMHDCERTRPPSGERRATKEDD